MLKRCCSSLTKALKNLGAVKKTASVMETRVNEEQIQAAKEIFLAGVKSVLPSELISKKITRHGNTLRIEKQLEVPLKDFRKCYVVGFGKAVLPMAEEMVKILGSNVNRCVVSVPEGTRETDVPNIEIFRGAPNNIPDYDSFNSAEQIVRIVQSCEANDLLFVLISGGGSSLLPYPKPPITLKEKRDVVKRLMLTGCNIQELNKVRKKISLVKGGGLAQICKSRLLIGIILSDVLGDPLDVIASGTTVENPDGDDEAKEVFLKYNIPISSLPESVQKVLDEKYSSRYKRGFYHVRNFIIGNNKVALHGAGDMAKSLGYDPIILSNLFQGRARSMGEKLVHLANVLDHYVHLDTERLRLALLDLNLKELRTPGLVIESVKKIRTERHHLCLLLGGETTVKVKGKGVGGRNQELALAAAIKLDELKPKHTITLLCAGTDGIDGPCPTAGAVVTMNTVNVARKAGIKAEEYLEDNNSYTFFRNTAEGYYHFHTGHTETNVMDLVVILIE